MEAFCFRGGRLVFGLISVDGDGGLLVPGHEGTGKVD